MESDNIWTDACVDVPTTDASILRDHGINSDASDPGKSSPKRLTNAYACQVDEQVAESEVESGIVGSESEFQLDNSWSMPETIALLSDAVQTKSSITDVQESPKVTNESEDTLFGKSIDAENASRRHKNNIPSGTRLDTELASTSNDDNNGEPFPDYYESCENNSQLIDQAREEAYKYAISKVVEEVVRFREVDVDLSSPDSQIISMSINNSIHNASSSDADNPTEAWELTCRSEIRKVAAFNEMTRILAHPDMKPNLRKRFMGITNTVIRMEYLLFHRYKPMVDGLIVSDRDLWELNVMAMESVKYLSSLDGKLRALIDDSYRVERSLNALGKEEDASYEIRYQRMAQVVMRNLRKPRSVERNLLCIFLDFYDSHVYTRFLQLYNRHIVREIYAPDAMLQLSRFLIGLWDVLNRAIEDYQLYVNLLVDMRDTYFRPVADALGRRPDIWERISGQDHEQLV